MSSYWKKKLEELEGNTGGRGNSSSGLTEQSSYWQKKLADLEEQQRKVSSSLGQSTTQTARKATWSDYRDFKAKQAEARSNKGNTTDQKRTWFDTSVFDDGFQWSDIPKVILGTNTDVSENVGSAVLGIGEKLVDAFATMGAYQTQQQQMQAANSELMVRSLMGESVDDVLPRYQQFIEDNKKGTAEFVEKDLYDEEAIAKKIISDPVKKVTGVDSAKDSILGEKSDALVQSAANLGVQLGVNAIAPGSGMVLMGATTFGSESENALRNGATLDEAALSGMISAGAEILTEKISGGIKIPGMGGTLDSALTRKLATGISSKFWRTAAKMGIDIFGEGLEEVASSVISEFGQWLTYRSEEELNEILWSEQALEEKLEAFIGGSVLGGFGSTFQVFKAKADGKDCTTGLTEDEFKVVRKAYDSLIAEEKTDKISPAKRNKLWDKANTYMDEGRISADFIESVLGGEDYSKYKAELDAFKETDDYKAHQKAFLDAKSLPALERQLAELGEKPSTVKNTKEYEELAAKIEAIKSSTTMQDLEAKLSPTVARLTEMQGNIRKDVYSRIKDTRLAETYRELARSKQKLDMDATQYSNEKERQVVQAIVDSGLMDNTNASKRTVEFLAKLSSDHGLSVEALSEAAINKARNAPAGYTVHGYITSDGKLALNMESPRLLQTTAGHEITHVFEGTELYDKLSKAVKDYCIAKEGLAAYNKRIKEAESIYSGDENTTPEGEVVADLVGEYLFTDEDFVNNLSASSDVFERAYNEVKYLAKIAVAGSKEARELEKVKRLFDKVYRQTVSFDGSADGKVQNSIRKDIVDVNGKEYDTVVELDKHVSKRVYSDIRRFKSYIVNSLVGLEIPVLDASGNVEIIEFAKEGETVTKNGKTHPALGELIRTTGDTRKQVIVNAEEVVNESVHDPSQPSTGNEHGWLDENGWETRKTYVLAKDGNIYEAYLKIAKARDGRNILYAVNLDINKGIAVDQGATQKRAAVLAAMPSAKKVSQKKPKVKGQNSISKDSAGRDLTTEQSVFFKDSKVLDELGNLKVMYHGTPNGDFTIFKDGTYFTDNKEYADRYQNPGASSISTGKAASNPKTFEVYLDIKKPFDLNDAEARRIYIEEYIKGGNAVGINPYLSDAEYAKIKTIDWTEGEDLRDFLIENDYDYDGLVLDEGADGGYGDEVKSRGTSYVVFSSEQVKDVNNAKPTDSKDYRFSISKTVEETRDLIALHNLKSDELLKSLDLGGFPMPSIAVIKAESGHDEYGEISLVFPKDTIDPKSDKANKVYGGDAWTPTYPRIEYKPSEAVAKRVRDRYYEMSSKYGYDETKPLYKYQYDMEAVLNNAGGEAGLLERLYDDADLMQLYLQDSGKGKVAPVVTETETRMSDVEIGMSQYVINALGADVIAEYKAPAGVMPIGHINKFMETHDAEIKTAYKQYFIDEHGFTEEQASNVVNNTSKGQLLKYIRNAYNYTQNNGITINTETDHKATEEAIRAAAEDGYEAWVDDLFNGVEEKTGIRNGASPFTPSGNRRGWDALHWEETLENVVKAMKAQDQTGADAFFGPNKIFATAAKEYKSIKDIKADSDRLRTIPKEEYDAIKEDLVGRFADIATRLMDTAHDNPFIAKEQAMECIVDAVRSSKTKNGISKKLTEFGMEFTENDIDDIVSLVNDIASMPTGYFEAKPQRAVGFDEVAVFVIPRNADIKLKQELLNRGYNIAEYDPDVEGDRQKIVNNLDEYKFSISPNTEEHIPFGYKAAKDLAYKPDADADMDIPIRDDYRTEIIADVDDEQADDLFPDDNATYQQMLDEQEEVSNLMRAAIDAGDIEAVRQYSEEYEAIRKKIAEYDAGEAERFNSLDDADAPPIRSDLPSGSSDSIALSKSDLSDIAANVRSQLGLSNKQMYDVHKLIEEYAQDGLATNEDLFEALKEKFGTYTENLGTDEAVRDAKKYLRTNGLHVAESIVREIPDFAALRRANRGRIRFSTNGTPVDVLYHELNSLYPHLFPEDIIAPTDMLMQMVEVAGMDSAMKEERRVDDSVLMGVAEDIASYVDDLRYTQREEASGIFGESFDNLLETADQYIPAAEDDDIPSIKPAEKATESPVPEKTAAQKTAEQVDARIEKLQAELDANRQNRAQSAKDYDAEIAELQAKYDTLSNKNSLRGNDILRSIERKKRLKATNDANYEKRITSLEERIEKMSSPEYRTAEQRRSKMQEHTDFWETLLGDTSTWKDMALGIAYKTKTLRRILRTVVRGADGKPDIAKADAIYDALETKYDHNEAQLKKESVRLKEVFKKLDLNSAEDTYAHMLGEFRHNPQTTLTEDVVNEYYEKHKKQIDVEKVNSAITEARKTFDELIVRVNEVLREQGMKEIPYRQGYFPHFTNPKQNWLQKLLNWKPVDNEIPTSIAGITEMFDPQRSWQGFNKQRKGDTTDYSLYQGLDTYIHGALDWIYHIDDLQSRRALENHIRYVHSEEGIKARIDEIKANERLDADEVQTQIEAVLAEAKNPLNNLVTELRARTNTLANKKSSMDRGMEEATNRKIYSTMTNLNNRINANMVVGSISSALTNFIPIVQSWHQVSPVNTVRGVRDLVRSAIKDDGMVAKSDFLTNRLVEEEKLYQTGWDKASNKAAWLMNVIDNISSQTVWRSKYLQNMQEGMSEVEAIKDADQFAKNVIAGRSRGNMPSIFDSKNPLIKMATAFQLEVANQYGFMFEDTPQDVQSKARLVKGYATAFIGAYVYNALYSSLVGRDAAFDPISIIEDLLRDFGLFDDDEEEEPEDIALNFVDNVLDELPFVSGLTGGGRIPLSSAIPYEGDYESLIKDISNGEVSTKELLKPLYYLALPFGGGQLKKTNEGMAMFDDDLPISGSYTDSGKLRFPVEDTFGNKLQAALFGQYASKNARDYFDNDRSPLGAKQIEEFQQLDIPIRDYWEIREGLAERSTTAEKIAYIGDLDLPIRKQNTLANNIVDRKTPIDMTDWDKYASYEEFDFAEKNPEKYDFLVSEGMSVAQYNNLPQKKKDAYDWAFENPEKYAVSKLVADDLVEYREYATKLNEIKADKTASGQTVSGSAKTKKLKYINGLDLDYGAKLILFKSEYPSDDTYNREIVEYVNDQSYTFEEKAAILRELGFTVTSNGTVTWK